ncbi:MAG: DUF1007 family protein [Bauldia sp.]
MQILRLVVSLAVVAWSVPAAAHPHVFVAVKAELVFDAAGRVVAARNIWQFDEAFSAFAAQGLDVNNDGTFTTAELAPLAQINMDSLSVYGFFTWLEVNGAPVVFGPPVDYWLEYGTNLTLRFTLPVASPFVPIGAVTLDVYDPEYFVAFDLAAEEPFLLVEAPAACNSTYRAPGELPLETMVALGRIPPDQMIPRELLTATAVLAHRFIVTCP